MTSHVIKNFLISIFIGTLVSALFWTVFVRSDTVSEMTIAPSSKAKPRASLPEFKITALQLSGMNRQVITCEAGQCESLPVQQSDDTPAVTDGVSWYHYETSKDRNDFTKLQLRRSWINSEQSDLIIEQTELVKPRGLYISPDNQKIAFWLDSTAQGNNGLTELWIYNTGGNGTKLVAEKIKKKGVLTKPRWNRASSHLFFLGTTVIDGIKEEAVHTVPIHTTSLSTPFTNIDWENNYELVESGAVDISRSGQAMAYVEPSWNKNILHIATNTRSSTQSKVRGKVPYIQWLTDDTLLYVVQGKYTFTFWKLSNGTHKHIAKYQGEFQSARADSQGKYLIFNTKYADNIHRTLALDIESGYIGEQDNLPDSSGRTYIIHFEQSSSNKVAGIMDQIDDDLIAGFIDKHFFEITQSKVKPERFIITDQPNAVFIDYTDEDKNRRILLNIRDITHIEWTIISKYKDEFGEWVPIQGGGIIKPNPVRLYEWEEEVNQWILKSEYNSGIKKQINP